jgi:hypothetical protein
MSMLKERLQVLISAEQRRRLEVEARRRGKSVGNLVREAIDAQYGSVTREDRLGALEGIRSLSGRYLPPEELNRVVESERADAAELHTSE